MMDKWISKEEFHQQVEKQKEKEETTPWCDLEEGKIYLIKKIEELTSVKFGQCYLLHIEDKEGSSKKVWSPSRLITYIKVNRKENQLAFFCSMGQERIDKKRSRNLFDLTFKDTNSPVSIFIEEDGEKSTSVSV